MKWVLHVLLNWSMMAEDPEDTGGTAGLCPARLRGDKLHLDDFQRFQIKPWSLVTRHQGTQFNRSTLIYMDHSIHLSNLWWNKSPNLKSFILVTIFSVSTCTNDQQPFTQLFPWRSVSVNADKCLPHVCIYWTIYHGIDRSMRDKWETFSENTKKMNTEIS